MCASVCVCSYGGHEKQRLDFVKIYLLSDARVFFRLIVLRLSSLLLLADSCIYDESPRPTCAMCPPSNSI